MSVTRTGPFAGCHKFVTSVISTYNDFKIGIVGIILHLLTILTISTPSLARPPRHPRQLIVGNFSFLRAHLLESV
jgi:hypothetical protein